MKPIREDVIAVAHILGMFGAASGLIANQVKCAIYPVRCDNFNLEDVMEGGFPGQIKSFPCNFLGLPLHYKQLRRVKVQPLIDMMANRLPTWKGRILNRAGRLKLLNPVLSSIPTYFLTLFAPAKWAVKRMDKIHRGFLWTSFEDARGGHYLAC